MIKEKAIENYKNGYSCSESIVKACIDEGLCDESLLPCATTFSAGMSSGCACGTVTGSQLVLGYIFGRKNKVTCCKVLCSGLEGMARKEHCTKLVADASEILEELIKVKV